MSDDARTPTAGPQSGCCDSVGRSSWFPWFAVWALFLSFSFVRAPIPAVNEPHYLGKARHFWDPTWCPGDFFLDSSNPHLVFYVVVGWLTKFLTLPQTACVARVVSLGLLASGWMALTKLLFRSAWTGVLAAAGFTLMMAWGNFSGEWLIGGVEAKVFAYACILWSAALWFRRRPVAAAVLAVGGVAFHSVVGMWVLMAGIGGWGLGVGDRWRFSLVAKTSRGDDDGPPVTQARYLTVAAAVLLVGSVLALLPAASLVIGGEASTAREADRILLTWRVGHHTDPLLFPASAYVYYAGLLIVWWALSWFRPCRLPWGMVQRFVAAALAITLVGLVIGWLPVWTASWPESLRVDRLAAWRLWMLKFYPFRLADLVLPAAVALLTAEWFDPIAIDLGEAAAAKRRTGLALTAVWLGTLLLPAPDANPSLMSPAHYADWVATCGWLREHTPPDALIATANEDWAVKWFAERPEYVNFKDCPQDAAGVIEWWRRRRALVEWNRVARADGRVSEAELLQLRSQTGIDYLLVSRYGPIDAAPVHTQGPFRVFALPAPE